jgi:hypothetical protein
MSDGSASLVGGHVDAGVGDTTVILDTDTLGDTRGIL